jgi:predicted ATPase
LGYTRRTASGLWGSVRWCLMPKSKTDLVGGNAAFRKALADAAAAARQDSPVLIYGETGSGKGVLADYIHRRSGREGRLVSLNCASFQPNLFESELFGYMRGSFTGAIKDTMGLFEAAQGGTLFLDEIGDTPLEIQPKLLRAIEEGQIRPVGSTREISVNVRLIFATNHDLPELIKAGKFREDLYYRISAFVVSLPPLRERRDDITELAKYFLAQVSPTAPALSIEAEEALLAYHWPGNVRELRSAMAYAAAQTGGRDTLLLADLPDTVQRGPVEPQTLDTGHFTPFRELYRTGAESPRLWAEFLLALNGSLGSNRFARHEILTCLRAVRGPEPTNNALVNEWTRHIKPVALRLHLIHEEGKKLRIDLDACRHALNDDAYEVDEEEDAVIETAVQPLPSLAERGRRTNLDAPRTTFIGRQKEVQDLMALVLAGNRLVTVTGPGGTGKTRLSREAGHALLGEFAGGVWFADLTESRNIEGVAYAVAQAMGVPLTGNQSPELEVATILQSRAPSVLILDNFEQVAEIAAATVNNWVRSAPDVRFIVTSRALLGIEGEQEFELQPLPLPNESGGIHNIARNEAVRLFVERARVHHVGFCLTEKSAAAVARICQRLEGMPLAIELAAARTVIMQPEQIAARLDKLFDVLKSTRRDLQPRQRSLAATLDWSFDLLTDVERHAFAQLSVFRGGFFLDAAERVLDLSSFPGAPKPIDIVQSLREKSLLRAMGTPYEARFAMYQLIREYAAEKWTELAGEPEQNDLFARFAEYYRAYAADWDARSASPDAIEALDRLDYSRSNFDAVLDWAQAQGQTGLFAEVTAHLAKLLRVRGPANQRVSALARALQLAGTVDSADRARLLFLLSQAEREAGDPARARPLAEQAVAVATRVKDEALLATATFNLAGMEYDEGNVAGAQALHREVLPIFRKLGNRLNEARVLSRMALLYAELGEFDNAIENSVHAEAILREQGDLPGVAFVLSNRGTIYNRKGEHEQGLKFIEQAEQVYRELEDKRMVAMCLGNRSLMNRQLRRFQIAEPLVRECSDLARELGDRVMLAKNLMNGGIMYVELARFTEAEAALKEAEQLFAGQQNHRLQAVCTENLAYVAGQRGSIDDALAGFERAREICRRDNAQDTIAGVLAAEAEILLEHNRPKEALNVARQAADHWRKHGEPVSRDNFRAQAALAQALDKAGDPKAARKAATEALELAGKLNFSANDASPFIPPTLKKLKKIRSD